LIVNVRKHIKTKARTTKRSLSLSLTQFTHERPTHTHTHTHVRFSHRATASLSQHDSISLLNIAVYRQYTGWPEKVSHCQFKKIVLKIANKIRLLRKVKSMNQALYYNPLVINILCVTNFCDVINNARPAK